MSDAVGVIVVGHAQTASALLAAAQGILPEGALADVVAIDAGEGETPELSEHICQEIARVDHGRGVALLVDLIGASPCNCAQRQGIGHEVATVAGLNLAMLLKLGALDLTAASLDDVAQACAASAERAVTVHPAASADDKDD